MNFTDRLPDRADKQHGFLNFVIVGKVKKINAGWQLYVCFHFFTFCFSVGTDVLSALSDWWLGTLRSEIVQAITGSVLPATVHPAPISNVVKMRLMVPRFMHRLSGKLLTVWATFNHTLKQREIKI